MQNFLLGFVILSTVLPGEIITFNSNWHTCHGFRIISETPLGVEVVFSLKQMVIDDVQINGIPMKTISIPGVFLPNNEGAPNLPGMGRYIAIPQGAQARVTILSKQTEVYNNIDIAPAHNIPLETDTMPLRYNKDMAIYGRNAYYPDNPVILSKPMKIRGVDVVIIGITPFQYNPITKELIVYKDLRVRVDFISGNGHFGEDRLRSLYWEPILQGHLLNYKSLPAIDFNSLRQQRDGYEYIIIVPDDSVFEAWADTIKNWRKLQGISTEVFTLSQIGGNTVEAIESFIDSAYNNWSTPPVAVLLLSDYPSSGDLYGITSPIYDGYVSDNKYADTDGDSLPDLNVARICAQNAVHLDIMVHKFLSYEREPYTHPGFYDHPLTATGWQTERWFQLCSEVMAHFWINDLSKSPVRQYVIYSGFPTPGCPWSTRQGTHPVVQYWYNLGWLPDTLNPYDTTFWDNGSPTGINNTINDGTFLFVLHNHGSLYTIEHLAGLFNNRYPFAFLFDVGYGRFNAPDPCFVEVWHRMPAAGGLGGIAASDVSYSFVNDTYGWGFFDGLWPQFDPGYPAHDLPGHENLRPGFANASGKYYLHASWMPDSAGLGYSYKVTTFHLYHMHGDAFTTLYSEMPQNLTVAHPPAIIAGATSFTVQANDSSIIALTVNGEIIGVAEGIGAPLPITIPPQMPGIIMKVTVTKANYYRYEADVPCVGTSDFLTVCSTIIDDSVGGNGDGIVNPGETIDYGTWIKKIGFTTSYNVYGFMIESDTFITVLIDSSWYADSILPGDSALSNPFYNFSVASACTNGHYVNFMIELHDTANTYCSYPQIIVYTPILVYQDHAVVGGNGNGILDPGETADLVVTIENEGGATAASVTSTLMTSSSYITINDASGNFGTIAPGNTANNAADPYTVTASPSTPYGTEIDFEIEVVSGIYIDTLDFVLVVGQLVPSDTGLYYAYYSGGPHLQSPVFAWFAIDSTQTQNPGTSLNLGDDETVQVSLPFTFVYYGVSYTQISICSNGWIAMGTETSTDHENTGIPDSGGPEAMVAGLWDDLDPGNSGQPSDVYYYYDASNNRFIVEWFRVEHWPSGYHEDFEIILYDPVVYPTPTGDGEIIVQYLIEMQQADNTLGIENFSETVGIQYYLDGAYDPLAAVVTDSFAIKYTTYPPDWIGIEEEGGLTSIPLKTMLGVMYPNPGMRVMNIRYQVASGSDISLCVYDAAGRLVRTIVDGACEPGYYTQVWNARDDLGRRVPAGIYFVQFQVGDYNKVNKVVLLK